jgi:hypothetical protein
LSDGSPPRSSMPERCSPPSIVTFVPSSHSSIAIFVLQHKATALTTPRRSKPPCPDSADIIVAEIEVSERWALRNHSCKPLCPGWSDLIVSEIEVSQRSALCKHSCKTLCPSWSDLITAEIEVSQHCALRQHSCKHLCPGCSETVIVAKIKVRQRWALRQHSCQALCMSISHSGSSSVRDASPHLTTRLSSNGAASKRTVAFHLPCHCGRRARNSCSSE